MAEGAAALAVVAPENRADPERDDTSHAAVGVDSPDDNDEFFDRTLAALERCREVTGHEFADPRLLVSALTHASGADRRAASNERLEFLGDAILGMVVCDEIYHRFPDHSEGDLTKIKSHVVSRKTCAWATKKLGLQRHLILGKGMAAQGVIPESTLADAFESLVAALYLDGGLPPARRFVLTQLGEVIDKAGAGQVANHKSQLQQTAQRRLGATPTYRTLEERGPDHAKQFKVAAVCKDRQFPPAWGRTKKDAEQLAALNALQVLDGLEPAEPPPEEVPAPSPSP